MVINRPRKTLGIQLTVNNQNQIIGSGVVKMAMATEKKEREAMKGIDKQHEGIALLLALLSGGGLLAWLLRNRVQGKSPSDAGSLMIEYSS